MPLEVPLTQKLLLESSRVLLFIESRLYWKIGEARGSPGLDFQSSSLGRPQKFWTRFTSVRNLNFSRTKKLECKKMLRNFFFVFRAKKGEKRRKLPEGVFRKKETKLRGWCKTRGLEVFIQFWHSFDSFIPKLEAIVKAAMEWWIEQCSMFAKLLLRGKSGYWSVAQN